MSFRRLFLVVGFASLVTACGGAGPAASHQPAPARPLAPASAQSDTAPAAKPTSDESSPAVAADAKSAYTIGGSSLSEVELETVQAALQKAGYALVGPSDPRTCGSVETVQLGLARQGKPVGMLALYRKARSATADCTPTSVKETYETWKKSADDPKSASAMIYDDKAEVLVAITIVKDGRAAKELMAAVVVTP